MFPGRPMPQQQNPYDLAPEVYVAAGRNQGYDKGFDEGYRKGYEAARAEVIREANQIIDQKQAAFNELLWEINSERTLVASFMTAIEGFVARHSAAKTDLLREFRGAYTKKTADSLSKNQIRVPPHMDVQFCREAPVTSHFIREALNS